jgi:indole-3-acetate monooxygenase
VSGRWPFASGPFPPKWVVGGCVVIENGQPRMGPMGPELCLALVPAAQAQFIDTWHSVGLRGSDSRDFALNEIFVAKDHAINLFDFTLPNQYADPMFNLPFPVLTGPTHSAVCLGAVRAGLRELADLARTKRSAFNPMQAVGESPVFQHRLAELAVRHAALEALTIRQIDDVARMIKAGEPATPLLMSRNSSWVGYVHQESTDILNKAFELAGSTPVYMKSSLQRRWRDVRVVAQHFGGSVGQYPLYGSLLVGAGPAPRGAH